MQQSYPADWGLGKLKSMKKENEAMKGGRLVLSAVKKPRSQTKPACRTGRGFTPFFYYNQDTAEIFSIKISNRKYLTVTGRYFAHEH
jgi:hypothetical protein